ncbi:hypothetical protein H4Q26_015788 [Puccinia striiformis f. sp. tritici PST-130]|nr:hypothetical protein H4Q26_015788 [Puccinia striiformis f. sp. tritici PST-130]
MTLISSDINSTPDNQKKICVRSKGRRPVRKKNPIPMSPSIVAESQMIWLKVPIKIEAPEPSNAKEIHVPDDQEYYLYAAGLERMTSPQNRSKQQSPSTPSTRRFRRSSTVCSSDSDITRVGSPLLIIKTGDHISSSSMSETSHVRGPVVEPVKPRRKPRPHWRIDIPLPSQFLGRAYNGSYVSPSQHSKFSIPESPDESPMTESPLRESPPAPTRTSRGRRQGVIFNVNNLPDELKRMALDQDSD